MDNVQVVWLMRAQLMTLAACGRTDLVYRAVETAQAIGADKLAHQLAGILQRSQRTVSRPHFN